MNRKTQQPVRNLGASSDPERLVDAQAERLMIANILARDGFFRAVGPQLTEDCFAVEQYQRVFCMARRLHEAGGDPVLSEMLRVVLDAGKTHAELGLPELSAIAYDSTFVELSNPAAWTQRLRRKAVERRGWRAAERLRLGIESGAGTAEELAKARQELKEIEGAIDAPGATEVTLEDAFAEIGIDNLLAEAEGMISTPWKELNGLTNGGPRPGELWLLASRPSVGKSTLALQWALHAAREGKRVLFVSLEMPLADLLKRTLSAEGDIPHGLLVRGGLSRDWRFRVAQTLSRIGEYQLKIADKLRSLPDVIAKTAATAGLDLLVIDYLGLLDPGAHFENRNQEVSYISRRLKLAALDYDLPVLALHQLNRASANENRPPQLSDLRDSGSLEQDADTVLLLDAPGQRAKDGDQDLVNVILGKQRNGVRGHKVPLRLEGRFCRLIEPEQTEAGVA
jgi:replicative DNA helicase